MAGLAFDTRVGWWLSGVQCLPRAVERGLKLSPPGTAEEVSDLYSNIHGLGAGIHATRVEREVCRVAVAAATIEPLYRAGRVPCPLADLGLEQFMTEYSDVVDDVVRMATGLHRLLEPFSTSTVILGPSISSGRLHGDADVLANNHLIEIKCVINPRSSLSAAIRQLTVYAAFLHPEEMSLLLPRQHTLATVDLRAHRPLFKQIEAEIRVHYEEA